MTDMMPFAFDDQLVRVVFIDGEPWFVLADVCRVLEHSNPSMAASRLDDDEKMTLNNAEGAKIKGLGGFGNSSVTIINESGLYSLILTSRKPEAKRFKRWVTHEVLPSIRKSGGYQAIPEDRPPLLDMPTEDVRAWTRMISECRMLHGKKAARQLWAMSPLPQVEGEAAETAPAGSAPDLEPENCLLHLLSWCLPRLEVTVGELLRQNDSTAQAALRPFGVLPDPRGWTHWVAVARCHPSLSRCFHGTTWAGNWSDALLQLPEARRHPHAVWFGRMSKAVLLPRALVDRAV